MGAPKKADWREERRKRAWELKVQCYLENHAEPWLQGVTIFACGLCAYEFCETLEIGAAFQNEIAFEPYPDLFQLAHLLDEPARERAGGKMGSMAISGV